MQRRNKRKASPLSASASPGPLTPLIVKCSRCSWEGTPQARALHEMRHDRDDVQEGVLCPLCGEKCRAIRELVAHAREKHSSGNAKFEIRNECLSGAEFKKWMSTKRFDLIGPIVLMNRQADVTDYRCSYVSSGKQQRAPGIHPVCTAFLTTTTLSNGFVQTEYCVDHLGHDRTAPQTVPVNSSSLFQAQSSDNTNPAGIKKPINVVPSVVLKLTEGRAIIVRKNITRPTLSKNDVEPERKEHQEQRQESTSLTPPMVNRTVDLDPRAGSMCLEESSSGYDAADTLRVLTLVKSASEAVESPATKQPSQTAVKDRKEGDRSTPVHKNLESSPTVSDISHSVKPSRRPGSASKVRGTRKMKRKKSRTVHDASSVVHSSVQSPHVENKKTLECDSKFANQETNMSEYLADEDFLVDKVLDKRIHNGVLQYKIKWKGYENDEDDTWEPVANLYDAMEMIEAFEQSLTASKNTDRTSPEDVRMDDAVDRKRDEMDESKDSEGTYNHYEPDVQNHTDDKKEKDVLAASSAESESEKSIRPTSDDRNVNGHERRYRIYDGYKIAKLIGVRQPKGDEGIEAVVQYEDQMYEVIPTNILVDYAPMELLRFYESKICYKEPSEPLSSEALKALAESTLCSSQ